MDHNKQLTEGSFIPTVEDLKLARAGGIPLYGSGSPSLL